MLKYAVELNEIIQLEGRQGGYDKNKHNSEEMPEQCAWLAQNWHTVEGNYMHSCKNMSAKLKWTMGHS